MYANENVEAINIPTNQRNVHSFGFRGIGLYTMLLSSLFLCVCVVVSCFCAVSVTDTLHAAGW